MAMLGLLALLLSAADGWVYYPGKELLAGKYRWSLPEDSTKDEGLGGGITWALSDDFCEQIIPRFKERDAGTIAANWYVNCEELTDSFIRAFATWSSNHKNINFKHVEKHCGPPGSDTSKCEEVELYIEAGEITDERRKNFAAYVIAKNAEWQSNIQYGVRTTAGVDNAIDYRIQRATMYFNTKPCWYLDNTFCAGFHAAYAKGENVVLMMQLLMFMTWAVSLGVVLFRLYKLIKRVYQKGLEAFWWELEELGRASFMIAAFFLVFPPTFYWKIFSPCMNCFDFEAAVAHEIGHVLGFNHPDTAPELNYKAKEKMGYTACLAPHNSMELTKDIDPDSIMTSTTTFNARACLSDQDLDGLYFLYPMCEGMLEHPACIKSKRNIGYVRLLLAVGMPFICGTIVVMIGQTFARRQNKKRFAELRTDMNVMAQADGTTKQWDRQSAREDDEQVQAAMAAEAQREMAEDLDAEGVDIGSLAERDYVEDLHARIKVKKTKLHRIHLRGKWQMAGQQVMQDLQIKDDELRSDDDNDGLFLKSFFGMFQQHLVTKYLGKNNIAEFQERLAKAAASIDGLRLYDDDPLSEESRDHLLKIQDFYLEMCDVGCLDYFFDKSEKECDVMSDALYSLQEYNANCKRNAANNDISSQLMSEAKLSGFRYTPMLTTQAEGLLLNWLVDMHEHTSETYKKIGDDRLPCLSVVRTVVRGMLNSYIGKDDMGQMAARKLSSKP